MHWHAIKAHPDQWSSTEPTPEHAKKAKAAGKKAAAKKTTAKKSS